MQTSWPQRIIWLIAIWGCSVLALAGVGFIFRLLMTSAGFTS